MAGQAFRLDPGAGETEARVGLPLELDTDAETAAAVDGFFGPATDGVGFGLRWRAFFFGGGGGDDGGEGALGGGGAGHPSIMSSSSSGSSSDGKRSAGGMKLVSIRIFCLMTGFLGFDLPFDAEGVEAASLAAPPSDLRGRPTLRRGISLPSMSRRSGNGGGVGIRSGAWISLPEAKWPDSSSSSLASASSASVSPSPPSPSLRRAALPFPLTEAWACRSSFR
jgi:hypothetical protein